MTLTVGSHVACLIKHNMIHAADEWKRLECFESYAMLDPMVDLAKRENTTGTPL